jgi:hypothetical protein
MSAPKRGLGADILGAHLGMATPRLVRRARDAADTGDTGDSGAQPEESNTLANHERGAQIVADGRREALAPRRRTAVQPMNNNYRVGTKKIPYERRDGLSTQKVTFTAPVGLGREIDRYCLDSEVSRSEWIVVTLQREMERSRKGRPGS